MRHSFYHSLKQKILLLGLMVGLLFAVSAEGRGTDQAWQKFKSGDLIAAKSESAKALKSAKNSKQKSDALKISGVVAYSLGSKEEAKKYFAEAKRLDPSQKLDSGEVFDPSVIVFFQSISPSAQSLGSRVKSSPPQQQKSLKKIARTAVPRARNVSGMTSKMAAKPMVSAAMKRPGDQRPPPSPQKKGTFIQVLSNVKSATISIDGILAGSPSDLIQVKAGKVVFEVAAVGYFPAKGVLNVSAGTTAKASVTLRLKNPPKAPPPNPQQRPATARANASKNNLSVARDKLPSKLQPKKVDIFGEEPPLAQGGRDPLGTSYQPVAELPLRPSKPAPQSPSLSSQAPANPAGNFNASPKRPQGPQNGYTSPQNQQPQMQQYPQQYPQPYSPQYGPSPYSQQFPQTFPQQYPQQYPQPYPQPYPQSYPQSYGQPPYLGGYPGPGGQAYPTTSGYPGAPIVTVVPIYSGAASPPPSSPAYDPYASQATPQSPAFEPAPNPFGDSGQASSNYKPTFGPSGSKKVKKKAKKQVHFAVSLLPIGIPQFVGGKPLLGTIFAAGQGGALYLWYKSKSDADKFAKSGQAEIASREAEGANQSDPEGYQAETEDFRQKIKKYVDDTRLKSYISLGGFGALWVLSFAESLVFGPATSTSMEPMDDTGNIASLQEVESTHYWQILPYEKGLSLGVTWNF